MGKQFVNKTDFENFKRRQSQRFKTEIIEDWNAPALLNSWVNYNAATHQPAGYYRDPLGVVHVRGTIKDGTATAGTVLFQLPIGYRPTKFVFLPIVHNGAWGFVYVTASGNVTLGMGVTNTYVTLDGLYFRAEQ